MTNPKTTKRDEPRIDLRVWEACYAFYPLYNEEEEKQTEKYGEFTHGRLRSSSANKALVRLLGKVYHDLFRTNASVNRTRARNTVRNRFHPLYKWEAQDKERGEGYEPQSFQIALVRMVWEIYTDPIQHSPKLS